MSPVFLVELIVMVVLAVSVLALGGGMALTPSQRRYELLRPVTWAMVFGALSMSLTGLTNMCVGLSRTDWSLRTGQIAFGGLAELLVPIMLTFSVLTVAWGLTAIGLRRLE
jgi:hypothetical protein